MARASQNYYPDGEYLNKKNRVFSLNQEMLDKINNIPDVIDNLTSTSSTDALSANMGRELSKQIQSLESGARWLSTWDSRFGIPNTFPGTLPYQYKAGDNYLVSQVSDTANYRPDGSQFIGDRSFVVETSEVHPGDSYIYDGTNWILQVNSPIEVNEYTAGDGIKIDENNEISVKASAIAGTGLTTDTNNNLIVDSSLIAWKADIPTNVSQLINDRGYITEDDINTKTFYISSSSDLTNAQAALDWYKDGKNPIVSYNNEMYYFKEYEHLYSKKLWFYKNNLTVSEVGNRTMIYRSMLGFDLDSEGTTVTGIRDYNFDTIAEVLDTSTEYSSPFIPQYDGSPTSKKYVDDNDVQKGSTAPGNPTQGMLWYDTTNDVLKSYDGNNWNEVGSDAADINTKTFYLANNQDTVTGQAILDWVLAGKNAIVWHAGKQIYFKYISKTSSRVTFHSEWYDRAGSSMPAPGRYLAYYIMYLDYSGSTLSSIADYYGDNAVGYLSTVEQNYRYTPSNDYDPATKKYVDDKFSAGNYIDIKNGVISAVGLQENLTAGDNITFYEYCHANTQGPCPDGFHIPTNDEATALLNTGITLGAWTGTDGTSLNNFETYLKAPGTGYYASMLRLQRSGCVERWTSSTFRQWNFGYKFSHTSASAGIELQQTACGTIIRPFKNEGVAPDSSWTTIYDGSSVAQGAGIFHNATEGIISISADGTTRITIADKNLGATQVWNYGDAFTADNIGKMYQWGNNYGFEFSATQPKTSADKVDASGYGPNRYLGGNYYYDDTFIQNSDGWDSSANKNLWGGNDLTGVRCDHMISAESKTYTAGTGINIDADNEISADTTVLATKTDLTSKQDKMSAGRNISISGTTINARDTEYTAGSNVTITCPTESDMKGPCPSGFHVPLMSEWDAIKNIWTTLGGGATDGTNFGATLKMPFAGLRWNSGTGNMMNVGFSGNYAASTIPSYYQSNKLLIQANEIKTSSNCSCYGVSVRPFKNVSVVPDNTWVVLYDGSSVAAGAGVFHNVTEGLISLSSDGVTRYTIVDKNLGATQVWNSGDTLSETNCGKIYQIGNNYGFDGIGGSNPSTTTTQVDASNYGPGNYYSSSTYVLGNDNWNAPNNQNLRGGVSQGTWQDCEHPIISAAGGATYTAGDGINIDQNDEISVDNTIARVADINTKTFYLANNSDLVTAQAAYDWWEAGKNPIVIRKYAGIESVPFSVYRLMGNTLEFTALYSGVNDVSYNTKRQRRMEFRVLNGTVNDIIFVDSDYINYIDPTATYSVPFIPTQDGQPATKKYVDDSISGIVIPTYTAGNGISIDANNEISIDTVVVATQTDIANFFDKTSDDADDIDDTNSTNKFVTASDKSTWSGKQDAFHTIASSSPSNPSAGDEWFDTTNNVLKVYDGTNWNTVDTNTTYTAGDGIDIDANDEISVDVSDIIGTGLSEDANNNIIIDTTVVATQTDLAGINQVPSGGTTGQVLKKTANGYDWGTDENTTYTAGTGLTLNGTTFNVDTTTIATKEDIANLRTFIVVNTLPSVDTANEKAIYMLGPIGTGSDKYEEYIVTRGDYNWASATTMYPFSVTRNTWDGSILHDSQTSPLSDFNGECYVGAKITAISDETKLPVKLTFKDPDSTDSEWVGLNEPAFVYEQYAYPDGNDLDIYIPGTSSSNRVTVSAEGVMSSSPITREQGPKQRTKIGETSIDLSGYATTSALTTGLATKQDTLTASTGININANDEITNTLPGPTIASTAPTGTEGALWYDTTNDVLMAYNGTAWKEAGTQMKVLSYGHSTWQDFINAYNENAIVYCKASSNSNPGSGNQGRMAFMAFIDINNTTQDIQGVEFQYYRSRSSHSTAANVLDEVYVYKLTPASGGTWTVTQRDTAAKPIAGTGIGLTYNSSGMTINNTKPGATVDSTAPNTPSEGDLWYDTTNDVLKSYDGTNWNECGSGGGVNKSWVTKTISGGEIELGIRTLVNDPSSNFTLTMPSTLIDGEEYILRVNNGSTARTITLGTGFTNPHNINLTLSTDATDQLVFLSINNSLELQPLITINY